ncbi:hypothetical protein GUITHDRAFT_154789 [Guillardia theta CCMP2712]|uniref:Uncharacterized protein n=1 Tax=Guillardia theta (strain CCMP2712) TaxID=905079 RepID=L1IP07_GUITC|nr:hypothetical protein GUITHDRAFT_154789 [Guillardia theta CCMP2712]EKX38003.1 hypothetical protein GUITHDRAFT_154789 [Guillardia theta CCMP2712]|eukprot:XP_005824983.1 hypothetical protein GUITHDRAFT_154789 [Guillardia theta CCMP2712]
MLLRSCFFIPSPPCRPLTLSSFSALPSVLQRQFPSWRTLSTRPTPIVEMTGWDDMWKRDGGLKPGQYFDACKSSPVLLELIQEWKVKYADYSNGKPDALVPGCGRGYDVCEFAKIGFNGLGLDISPTAVKAAEEFNESELKSAGVSAWKGDAKFSTDDFFTLEGRKFDVIYDYTFLCAIEPNMRKSWAEKMKQLLKPGGELVTLIFPLETREGGPPYAMSIDLVTNLLEPEGFVCDYLESVPEGKSHKGRGGKEALGRWRLKK